MKEYELLEIKTFQHQPNAASKMMYKACVYFRGTFVGSVVGKTYISANKKALDLAKSSGWVNFS
jgi:hypothetical protein